MRTWKGSNNRGVMKKAVIIGIASVDGSYLAEFLLEKGYEIVGTVRAGGGDNMQNIEHLQGKCLLEPADLLQYESLASVIQKHQPQEVYNLAALSLPSASWQAAHLTGQVNGLGPLLLLEAIRTLSPHTHFFQASSREIFGEVSNQTANEDTPIHPVNPYGSAKAYAHFITQVYRQSYGIYAVSGILFNHESPRRPLDFITRKITAAAACIKNQAHSIPADSSGISILNPEKKLELWDLDSPRDRGFAGDYVEAMWLMLQHPQPQDFIIASGQVHSVKDICRTAFEYVGLNWADHVVVKAPANQPRSTDSAIGDATRIKQQLGWSPKVSFEELIKMMVQSDLQLFT